MSRNANRIQIVGRVIGAVTSTIAALTFAGCAAVPPPPEAEGISVQNITDQIRCELASVYKSPYASVASQWAAQVTLNVKVTNTETVNPTVTVSPVVSPATLTVPIGPNATDQSERDVEIIYNQHMRDLSPVKNKFVCPLDTGLPQAASGLGVSDWINSTAANFKKSSTEQFSSTVYDLEFVITRGLNGGITYQSSTVNIQAGGNAFSKVNDNHLIIAMSNDSAAVANQKTGKTTPSASAQNNNASITNRFLPQRLIIQNNAGQTFVPTGP